MLGMEGPQGKDAGRKGRKAIFSATMDTALSMLNHRDTMEKALSHSAVRQELREGTSALVWLGFTLSSTGFLGNLRPAQHRQQWTPNLGPGSDHTDALRHGSICNLLNFVMVQK